MTYSILKCNLNLLTVGRSHSVNLPMPAAVNLDWRPPEREGEGDLWAEPEKQRSVRHHDVPQEPTHQSLRESGLPAEGEGNRCRCTSSTMADAATFITLPNCAQASGQRAGVGVIGVIECNFLKPAHNKQDFEYTKEYRYSKQNQNTPPNISVLQPRS